MRMTALVLNLTSCSRAWRLCSVRECCGGLKASCPQVTGARFGG